ncbi:hypothetical protein BGX31_007358 [Mortierella sp. GBA43]|nr:hypothetical protein BGX31_007358 [Mortierella sp. GBA43]
MFDIAELDDPIYRQLDRKELARCARVNKTWNAVAIPYLWHDFAWLCQWGASDSSKYRFSSMVLEDYLHEMQGQSLLKKEPQTNRTSRLPALSKYGRWIRVLPCPSKLREILRSTIKPQQPTVHEVLLHLFRRCPAVQIQEFHIDHAAIRGSHAFSTTIIDFVLPRVRQLSLRADCRTSKLEPLYLMNFLDQCSDSLEMLTLYMDLSPFANEHDDEEGHEENESMVWTSLKTLNLHRYTANSDCKEFWRRLLKRCGHVESLGIGNLRGVTHYLAEGMSAHMHSLNKMYLGLNSGDGPGLLTDADTATLLSSSGNRWTELEFGPLVDCGEKAMEALAKSFSTLEVVKLRRPWGFDSYGLVQTLSSCPKLRILADGHDSPSRISANAFIDRDPGTKLLRTWACENSLKVLKVRITELQTTPMSHEMYPNQARDIQNQVYDRLARLTNLEILWLGDAGSDQSGCLDLSVDNGLYKLSGLRSLRNFGVAIKESKIDVEEVQWMVEHWRRLRSISNLSSFCVTAEAADWLHEYHPEIAVIRCHW